MSSPTTSKISEDHLMSYERYSNILTGFNTIKLNKIYTIKEDNFFLN